MEKLISTNPARNYEVVGEVDVSSDTEIKDKVKLANDAKLMWKELGVGKRVELLRAVLDKFQSKTDEMAVLISKETGKPITESTGEAKGFLEAFGWFLDNAESALADEVTHNDEKFLHKIVYEPFGVAAVITPWNYPLGMAIWGIVPNLVAGNTVVFKISEECPLMGKLIEEAFSGLPSGVFSEVYGAGDVGQKLAESDINLIWFTGSSAVGRNLYKIAADKFIKVVLELGGSNPCIVFDNPDIPLIYFERFSNCGQVCDAIKRLIVHESIFDEVVSGLAEIANKKVVGDSLDENTEMSSLVAKRQLDLLQEQVKDALDKGAKMVVGGPSDLSGAYYKPTILVNVTKDMRVWKEEVFGPVLSVVSFKTEEEAVSLGNDTPYGLGSRVFTSDLEKARRVASKLEAGTVEINSSSRWMMCNPFGGCKQSGMGREHGVIGFRELTQVKVIVE